MEYGLIGGTLGHSYSKLIHEQLCDYSYQLCPLPTPQEADDFMHRRAFKAINVTIPYKQLVIPHCAFVDPKAKAIGAVNTVLNKDGILHGYNTDYDGFARLAAAEGVSFAGKQVLISGTGATSRTVTAVAQDAGAKNVLYASRTMGENRLSYQQAATHAEVEIIVNTSPAGMYPHNDECNINPADFPNLQAVLDVVYNPFATLLVQRSRALGIPASGGLAMLVEQAAAAAQLFTGRPVDPQSVKKVTRQIWADRANIVLVGMPSCGKTTIGKQLAKQLNKPFVDLDAEIVKAAGKPISQIFAEDGEAAFRNLESRITAQVCAESGQVISTGGGVIKRQQNVYALRQNGLVVFIDRSINGLVTGGGRPLSTNKEALQQMYNERLPLYQAAAHITVPNHGEVFNRATKAAKEAIDAFFDTQRP